MPGRGSRHSLIQDTGHDKLSEQCVCAAVEQDVFEELAAIGRSLASRPVPVCSKDPMTRYIVAIF